MAKPLAISSSSSTIKTLGIARVRVAARRGVRAQEVQRGETIEIEELVVDPRSFQAYVDGENVGLTPAEFRLLYALASEQGRVLTRDELLRSHPLRSGLQAGGATQGGANARGSV